MNTCDVIDSSWMVALRVRREFIPVCGLAGGYGPGIANHEFEQVRWKAWNRCEFHALDTSHGNDEHPVRQMNLKLLTNQKFLQSGGGCQRINFRRGEFKRLRRPVRELDGDRGKVALALSRCRFFVIGLHNLLHSMCGNRPTGQRFGCHELRFSKAAREPPRLKWDQTLGKRNECLQIGDQRPEM